MLGIYFQHFRRKSPVLVNLRRQLHEVAWYAADTLVVNVFEELVKGKDLPATAKQQKQETPEQNATASTAPIIEDGKTLDELIAPNDAIGQYLLRTMRADGATDQEIWQALVEN